MARPTIDRLFDHTLRVWRPSSSRDDLGAEVRSYEVVAEGVGCAVKRSPASLADVGPGLAPAGRRRFYLRPDVDVRPRDVLEVLSGPDAVPGLVTWEVDEPPVRPSGHHTQVDAVTWSGDLEGAP